tara:strand:- start:385 stop:612 length:228 start_codon:yes stop_codon:yes gene_type:complete
MIIFDKENFLRKLLDNGYSSQKMFALKTGISEAQVTNIVNNKHSPTLKTLSTICENLNCEIETITKTIDKNNNYD